VDVLFLGNASPDPSAFLFAGVQENFFFSQQ